MGRLTAILGGLLALAAVLASLAILTVSATSSSACNDTNHLRDAIVLILQRGEADLPHSSFFKHKQKDLIEAEQAYSNEILQLQSLKCS